MQAKFYLSTLQDSQSVREPEELIVTFEPDAKINLDSQVKTVEIKSEASGISMNWLLLRDIVSIE